MMNNKSMKLIIWGVITFSILSNGCHIYINRELKTENAFLEDENIKLEERLQDLENEVEELEAELNEKEKEDLFTSQEEHFVPTFQTSEFISDSEDNTTNKQPLNGIANLNISLSNSIQTTNYHQVQLISPTLENLHYLFSLSETDFKHIMNENGYSLSTAKDCFVSPSPIRYCTVKKDLESINMIFTKNISITNNIEASLNNIGLEYIYEDGFKIYMYMFNNLKFALYIKTGSNGMLLALRNI